MQRLAAALAKIPLFIKVVSLYIVLAVPLYTVSLPVPAQTVDTNQYISGLVEAETKPPAKQAISGVPNRLVIPRLGIDLPVEDGVYDPATQTWSLSKLAVHYALMTSLPNDTAGHTLIYGHNTVQVLAPTRNLQPGDILQIIDKDGKIFTYKYTSDVKVSPTDTQVLTQVSETPKLTLLTCNGLWSEVRRLMSFDFVSVEDPTQPPAEAI